MFNRLIMLCEGKVSIMIVCATLKHCEKHSTIDLYVSSCIVCIRSWMILKQCACNTIDLSTEYKFLFETASSVASLCSSCDNF